MPPPSDFAGSVSPGCMFFKCGDGKRSLKGKDNREFRCGAEAVDVAIISYRLGGEQQKRGRPGCFQLFPEPIADGAGGTNRIKRGTAAGDFRMKSSVTDQKFPEQHEQRKFSIQSGGEVIVDRTSDGDGISGHKGFRQRFGSAGIIIADLCRIQMGIGPAGADRETGIDDEQRRDPNRTIQRYKLFSDTGGEAGTGIQKKRNIRPESGGEMMQLLLIERPVTLLQQPQCRGSIGTAAAHAGGDGNAFGQGKMPMRCDSGTFRITARSAADEVVFRI